MSATTPGRLPYRRAALSMTTLVGGVALAVVPAAVLSIASRTFTIADQGSIALSVTIGIFLSQVVTAVLVESRLSSRVSSRSVAVPVWLSVLAVATAIVVALFHDDVLAVCIGLPLLVSALEVGRGVSVAERLDVREAWAAAAVGIGALVGVLVGYLGGSWGIVPLVAGIAVATIIRTVLAGRKASALPWRTAGWVTLDVSITGIVYPIMNSVILAVLGPRQAILFAAISTVSGLLAIPLNFMRLRLLKEHSLLDIVVSTAALIVAAVVIALMEGLGLLTFIFGTAWTVQSTAAPLAVACLWRAASLATTLPFAALRRRGAARLVMILRAIVAAVTFAAAVLVVPSRNLVLVFAVLLASELAQALVYESARRALGRSDRVTS